MANTSPTKYDVAKAIAMAVKEDVDLGIYCADNFIQSTANPESLAIYLAEDFRRIPSNEFRYPLVHSFGYAKLSTKTTHTYSMGIEVAVLRNNDESGLAIHDNDGIITYEAMHNTLDVFTELVIETIDEYLRTTGVNNKKGFEIINTNVTTIPPQGEGTLLSIVELEITLNKC